MLILLGLLGLVPMLCTSSPIPFTKLSDRDTSLLTSRYDIVLKQVQLYDYTQILYQSTRYKNAAKVFHRLPYMNFADAVQNVSQGLKGEANVIKLYADLLQFDGQVVTLPSMPAVHIYAREILSIDGGHLTLGYNQSVAVRLATPYLPSDFNITFVEQSGTGQTTTVQVKIPEGMYGVQVNMGSTGPKVLPFPAITKQDLSAFDYMGDLMLTENTFLEDDLPRLLEFQLLLATAWMPTDPALANSVLKYIIASSVGSSSAYPVYSQANSLLTRLSLVTDPLESYVPDLDITVCKVKLDANVAVAQDFETAFNTFSQMEVTATQAIAAANVAYDNSITALNQYKFLEKNAEANMISAKQSLLTATKNYNDAYNGLPQLYINFQTGILEWQAKKTGMLILGIVESIFQMFMSVGAAAVTMEGQAAEAVVTAAQDAKRAQLLTAAGGPGSLLPADAELQILKAGTDANMAQALGTVKSQLGPQTANVVAIGDLAKGAVDTTLPEDSGLQQLAQGSVQIALSQDMLAAVQLMIRGIDDMVNTTLARAAAVANGQTTTVSRSASGAADIPFSVDTVNLKVQWDLYRTSNQFSWEKFSALGIDGSAEYYQGLLSMSDYAEAVLAAQLAYAQVSNDWTVASNSMTTGQIQSNRLDAARGSLQSPIVFDTFKRAMFDRLIAVRGWVGIDFANYAAAYKYYTLKDVPISVPILSPAVNYRAAIASLQSSAIDWQAQYRAQKKTFVLDSSEGAANVFGDDWKHQLASSSGLQFTINTTDTHFKSVGRVRVQEISAYLVGTDANNVEFTFKMGGEFQDKTTSAPFTAIPFISDGQSLQFEYVPSPQDPWNGVDAMILEHGRYADINVFTTPTPFTDWNVEIDDAAALEKATKLVMKIDCEYSLQK